MKRDYDAIVQVLRVGILIAETEAALERLKNARRLTVNFADAPRPDGTLLFAEKVLPNL